MSKIPEEPKQHLFVVGIDLGSVASKAVVLDDNGNIIAYNVIPIGVMSKGIVQRAFSEVLLAAELKESEISYVVSTGYGREKVSFGNRSVTEITCHARGVHVLFPGVRTVIDIGGQDSKAMSIDEFGKVKRFATNDRCAAGTGRWLEVIARALNVSLENMGRLALDAKDEIKISSVCTVFAETEVISYLAGDRRLEDILGGIHRAIAERIVNSLVQRVGVTEEVAVTGGVAKNIAVVRAIERLIGTTVVVPLPDPQITGALGAAVIGLDQVLGMKGGQERPVISCGCMVDCDS
jgi:predicted CoA-substrate-specific enzyme activase